MNLITDNSNTLLQFIQSNGLGVFIVLFTLSFIRFPLWNWFTKTYYPSRIKIEQDRNDILKSLNENLIWLTYLIQRQETKINTLEDKLTGISVTLGLETLETMKNKNQVITNSSGLDSLLHSRETASKGERSAI